MQRFAALLNVRTTEARVVALMLGHLFCLGLARTFSETTSNTLFVVKWGAAALPISYVVLAFALPVLGLAYEKLQARASFARLQVLTVLLPIAMLGGLRVLLASEARWPALLAIVGYNAMYLVTNLSFWELASRFFDVRQGKRLFGLIGSGEVLASIIGGFLTPWLAGAFGAKNLILLGGGALLGSLCLQAALLRTPGAQTDEIADMEDEDTAGGSASNSLRDLLRDRYLALIFLSVALNQMIYWSMDNFFYVLGESRYPNEDKLAGFIGTVEGVTGVLNLAMNLFVSSKLLGRFGRFGLMGVPVAVAGLCGMAVAASLAPAMAGLFFWFGVVNRVAYNTLYGSLYDPSYRVLFQPLPTERRDRAAMIPESYIEPVMGGVTGLLLLLLAFLFKDSSAQKTALMLVVLAGALVIVVRNLAGQYGNVLKQSLAKRLLSAEHINLNDPAILEALRQGLSSPQPGPVLYSMNVLREGGQASLTGALPGLLQHPVSEVRRHALLCIEELDLGDLLDQVRSVLVHDAEVQVQAAALRTLAVVGDESTYEETIPYLRSPEQHLRTGALVGLLRSGAIEGVVSAGEHLLQGVNADDSGERAFAARVLGDAGIANFYRPLFKLLRDDDLEVRRAALSAAGRLKSPQLWPRVVEQLASSELHREAAAALNDGGASALR